MSKEIIKSALSIRQPYAELIMQGKKKIEYRTVKTKKLKERIYIYASLTPGWTEDWEKINLKPGDLPIGVLIGTVEIVDCQGVKGDYEWILANPSHLEEFLKPENQPQPIFFKPFK